MADRDEEPVVPGQRSHEGEMVPGPAANSDPSGESLRVGDLQCGVQLRQPVAQALQDLLMVAGSHLGLRIVGIKGGAHHMLMLTFRNHVAIVAHDALQPPAGLRGRKTGQLTSYPLKRMLLSALPSNSTSPSFGRRKCMPSSLRAR